MHKEKIRFLGKTTVVVKLYNKWRRRSPVWSSTPSSQDSQRKSNGSRKVSALGHFAFLIPNLFCNQ